MTTRRHFIQASAALGATGAVAASFATPRLLAGKAQAESAATVIDPTTIPKYVTPLFVLPAMPRAGVTSARDVYRVAARRFSQQILPSGYPRTNVFGFGSTTNSASFHAPGYTLVMPADRQTQVTWSNQLMASSGAFLPPLLTVDPTIHWANPPGGVDGRDSTPVFTSTPPPYTGPLPLTVHLHGGHTFEESDGYPESWFLPPASNIPAGYARTGSFYDQFKQEALDRWGVHWPTGGLISVYPSDQRAATLWYHDHSIGMTRTSVHSGLAGLAFLRGGPADLPAGVLPGPAPKPGDASGLKYREIALVFQDKSFNTDGSLFFPPSRTFAGDTTGPFIPETDVPPYWNPTFNASTIVVNGRTWPFFQVEPRRYRFRILNSCNIRPLTLKVVADPNAPRPAPAALPIWVIGSDGGFLPAPASLESLPILTSERYDFIIDFTGRPVGSHLFLSNEGGASDPATTGQMMRFDIVPLTSQDTTTPPAQLTLPSFAPVGPATSVRKLSMSDGMSANLPGVISQMHVGTLNADGTPNPMMWDEPLTEHPALNSIETWELHNFGAGGHAIHLHLVEFTVVNRETLGGGTVTPPAPYESGHKDTLSAPPGMITRIRSPFDRKSRYVWHCHFIDHEDHDMMRPYVVG